ncbi:hypothetical protein [Cellulomonas soli]
MKAHTPMRRKDVVSELLLATPDPDECVVEALGELHAPARGGPPTEIGTRLDPTHGAIGTFRNERRADAIPVERTDGVELASILRETTDLTAGQDTVECRPRRVVASGVVRHLDNF